VEHRESVRRRHRSVDDLLVKCLNFLDLTGTTFSTVESRFYLILQSANATHRSWKVGFGFARSLIVFFGLAGAPGDGSITCIERYQK
jgi:hypothetical protein